MMNDDMDLVRAYAVRQSEAAFATLVARHVHLVHSAALRQVNDPHLAGEVTQTVFIILARKAAGLSPKTILSGWLYRTAQFAAKAARKREQRRQHYEQEAFMQAVTDPNPPESAWEQWSPLLEEAMAQLRDRDRDAIVLRYFENRSLKEVGGALGVEERAAQKRVARGLERLRAQFAKRGLALTTLAIAGAISAHSVQAAPVALTQTVTTVALAKGAAASGSTLTLIKGALKLMAWTKINAAVVVAVGVLLAAGTATVAVEKHREANQYIVGQAPWSDMGAATPQAALQSLAWALSHDQFDRAEELLQWDESNPAFSTFGATVEHQEIFAGSLAPHLKELGSIRIISITPTGQPNELIVKLEKTFKNKNIVPFAVTAKLRRAGGRWRVVAKIDYFANGNVSSMRLPFMGSF